MIYVLILVVHVGVMGSGDSSAVTTQEFTSFDKCQEAGKSARQMLVTTVKNVKFVCVVK